MLGSILHSQNHKCYKCMTVWGHACSIVTKKLVHLSIKWIALRELTVTMPQLISIGESMETHWYFCERFQRRKVDQCPSCKKPITPWRWSEFNILKQLVTSIPCYPREWQHSLSRERDSHGQQNIQKGNLKPDTEHHVHQVRLYCCQSARLKNRCFSSQLGSRRDPGGGYSRISLI